jgi:large subunit ribosomal protein L31e
MSQELERVYTINLGKVLLSPNNQRAKRAINMVKEFARHHMKNEQIKIEEDLSHQIWKRGIKHPPRKIRVKMTKTDEGFILVSPYEEEIESEVKPTEEKEKPTLETKPEGEIKKPETKPGEIKETKTKKESELKPAKETKSKESKPAKETKELKPAKETKAKSKTEKSKKKSTKK